MTALSSACLSTRFSSVRRKIWRLIRQDLEADAALCASEGVNIVFHPEPEDMYGPNFSSHVAVEKITSVLCGKSRPAHFQGVTTVVNKLFNISKADRAYFGEKTRNS